jgi:hypothetical protein
MAVETSRHQLLGQTFLANHPVGTTLTDAQLLNWAEEKGKGSGNGLASALAIDDPRKRIASVRRLLNDGLKANGLAEDQRAVIEVTDPKHGHMRVNSWAYYVAARADVAFNKSMSGALNPLLQSKRMIDGLNLDEVPPAVRELIEARQQEILEATSPLAQVYSERWTERWVHRLMAAGQTRESALAILDNMPAMSRDYKLKKLTQI